MDDLIKYLEENGAKGAFFENYETSKNVTVVALTLVKEGKQFEVANTFLGKTGEGGVLEKAARASILLAAVDWVMDPNRPGGPVRS